MRPSSEPVMDSIRVAVRSFPDNLEIVRQAALLRVGIGAERAADQLRVVQTWFADVLCEFISRRTNDAFVADVAGNMIAAALVAAVDAWGSGGCVDDIDTLVNRALDMARAGLQDLG
jgi:hypothetical protein